MRRLTLLLILSAALVACRGCDDSTSQNNTTTNVDPTACVDSDEDGFGVGADCEGPTDCNDSDPDVHPDADEACDDGRDNNCDNNIDEGCVVEGPCVEGATRECGKDLGRCTIGSQTCTAGSWTQCDGVAATSESCNGEDDDCDGETDENPIDLCDDGLICNGVSTCENGACAAPVELDCTEFDGPCTAGMCSEKDRGCRSFPLPNETACDDGFFCTENGSCNAGECVTTPRDCSAEEDTCNIGVCDETADACVKQPKSDGITCDDGAFCTTGDTCTAGVCAGPARDCAAAGDQCNTGICDETLDACAPMPIPDGATCEDGAYCTVTDTCIAGACVGGAPRQCGAVGGSCRDGVCDEALDACTGDPVADGTTCEDGQFCTSGDTCVAGNCMGGGPRNCSAANGVCRVGTCNETTNVCVPAPSPDGTTCDDGLFCTTADRCTAGACGGTMRNCASAGGECTIGSCDEAADACVGRPASDGSACPDSLFCTQNEICLAGACTRTPRNCAGSGDNCNDGVCDENGDACVSMPKANGTMCTDGMFCTTNDTCQAGVCSGGPTSCSQLDDVCTVGTCDETANTCTGMALPDLTLCDDTLFCTQNDRCSGGVCVGAQRNCAAQSNNCNIGVCDDTADACVASPVADGAACSDGNFCTVPDTCTAGVCGGPPRDCSNVSDGCNVGTCSGSACVPVPVANDTPCSTPAYCEVNTRCLTGVCVGDQRDCSGAPMGNTCLDGACDESINACITLDNGTCDVCLMSRPTSNAGPDQNAIPNQSVMLNGGGSTDPTNQTLTYAWRIDQAPVGSTAQLSSTNARNPALLADLSGTFVVCLTVTDTDSCVATEDCMNIVVAPVVALHIELVWFSDLSDMDLHYQAPNYAFSRWFGTTGVVWYNLPTPDWGGGATGDGPDGIVANNPRLDVDNRTGFGPENINQNVVFDGNPFTIGVHFWSNTDTTLLPFTGPTDARIRVFESGNPVPIFERTRNLKCQDFWEVANVRITGGGTSVAVTAKNTVQTFDPGGNPTCRCNSNSDCRSGETCKAFRLAGGGPPRFADLCAP